MGEICRMFPNGVKINDIGIAAGVEYKNRIYFSAYRINGLFEIDIDTGITTYIKRFDKEESKFAIHRTACFYGDKAWFIPQMGKYIAVVDMKTFEIEYITPICKNRNKSGIEYTHAVYYSLVNIDEKRFFLVPASVDVPLLIDMEKNEIQPFYDVIDVDSELYLFGAYDGECVWMFPYVGNKFLKINANTYNVEKIMCNQKEEGYCGVVYLNGFFWDFPFKSDNIRKIHAENLKIENIKPDNIDLSKESSEFVVNVGDAIWFLPWLSHHIIKYDCIAEEFSSLDIDEELLYENAVIYRPVFSKKYMAFSASGKGNEVNYHVVLYDFAGNIIKWIKPGFLCPVESLEQILGDLYINIGIKDLIFLEDRWLNLQMLFYVAESDIKTRIEENFGKSIYQYIAKVI